MYQSTITHGRTSLSYRGPTVWNILPEPYKLTGSYASFKQKTYLFKRAFDLLVFTRSTYCII